MPKCGEVVMSSAELACRATSSIELAGRVMTFLLESDGRTIMSLSASGMDSAMDSGITGDSGIDLGMGMPLLQSDIIFKARRWSDNVLPEAKRWRKDLILVVRKWRNVIFEVRQKSKYRSAGCPVGHWRELWREGLSVGLACWPLDGCLA